MDGLRIVMSNVCGGKWEKEQGDEARASVLVRRVNECANDGLQYNMFQTTKWWQERWNVEGFSLLLVAGLPLCHPWLC